MLPDDDKRYAIESCRSSESVLKKWFKINDIQLVHLLVLWYLVNIFMYSGKSVLSNCVCNCFNASLPVVCCASLCLDYMKVKTGVAAGVSQSVQWLFSWLEGHCSIVGRTTGYKAARDHPIDTENKVTGPWRWPVTSKSYLRHESVELCTWRRTCSCWGAVRRDTLQ